MTLVNEGLKAGDLEGVVSKRFSVDQFKSKMGDDRNIMVLAFKIDGMAPAKDLERFAETGYKEVLDADAFEYFKEEGIFNKTVADKFKTFVLSQGGTENPMTLYKKFRGQEPKPEALLRRAGLIE